MVVLIQMKMGLLTMMTIAQRNLVLSKTMVAHGQTEMVMESLTKTTIVLMYLEQPQTQVVQSIPFKGSRNCPLSLDQIHLRLM